MAEAKTTPEERLLKIIETSHQVRVNRAGNWPKQSLNAGAIKKWFAGLKTDKEALKDFANLHTINKAFVVVSAGLTLFWIFDFAKWHGYFKNRLTEVENSPASSVESAKENKDISVKLIEVLDEANKRNIFRLTPSQPPPAAAAVPTAADIVSRLKLVGILWSDNPQAMIEDSKEQKTYLLTESEQIADIKIKKILKDKVVVGKDEQEWDLR